MCLFNLKINLLTVRVKKFFNLAWDSLYTHLFFFPLRFSSYADILKELSPVYLMLLLSEKCVYYLCVVCDHKNIRLLKNIHNFPYYSQYLMGRDLESQSLEQELQIL